VALNSWIGVIETAASPFSHHARKHVNRSALAVLGSKGLALPIITAFRRTLVSKGSETMKSIAISVSSNPAGRDPTVMPPQQKGL
jgi:hypothetical protein